MSSGSSPQATALKVKTQVAHWHLMSTMAFEVNMALKVNQQTILFLAFEVSNLLLYYNFWGAWSSKQHKTKFIYGITCIICLRRAVLGELVFQSCNFSCSATFRYKLVGECEIISGISESRVFDCQEYF